MVTQMAQALGLMYQTKTAKQNGLARQMTLVRPTPITLRIATKTDQFLDYLNSSNMKHLKDVNMGYFQHLWFAWSMGFALLIHGVFPSLFTTYASDKIKQHDNSNLNS